MKCLYLSAVLGASTLALSGCVWLNSSSGNDGYNYQTRSAAYSPRPVKGGCATGSCLSTVNLEGAIGTAFIGGGDVIAGSQAQSSPNAVVNTIRMSEAYDAGIRGELGGSYALTPNRKLIVNGFYQRHAGNNNVEIATVGAETLLGSFSDYETYGVEGGARQYFRPTKTIVPIRPYIEAKLGGAYVKDINLERPNLQNRTATPLPAATPFIAGVDSVALYQGGWVPTAAAMIGFETPVAPFTTIGIEGGVRYTGRLKFDDSVSASGNPLSGATRGTSPWTIPVMIRGRYRF